VPARPIRAWQIWNEPNLTYYWSEQPFARRYVKLLWAARRAIRRVDPGARVVLAGLVNESWTALKAIYRAGGRGAFDIVALHPYTASPRRAVRVVELARRVMRRRGDGRKPVWITELSWPAASGTLTPQPPFVTDERGQAARLRAGLPLLARNRHRLRIGKVIWYTWLSREGAGLFGWSGLRRLRGDAVVDAPSLAVFKRAARRLERR
jgi:hypothetical protein